MPTALVAVLVACLAVGIVGGLWLEPRLHAFLVRHAQGSAWRGALWSAGVQLAALGGFGVLALVASTLDSGPRTVLVSAAAIADSPVLLLGVLLSTFDV